MSNLKSLLNEEQINVILPTQAYMVKGGTNSCGSGKSKKKSKNKIFVLMAWVINVSHQGDYHQEIKRVANNKIPQVSAHKHSACVHCFNYCFSCFHA